MKNNIKKVMVGAVMMLALTACSNTTDHATSTTPATSTSTSTTTSTTPTKQEEPVATATETTEKASPYVTLNSPDEAFLTYNVRSYWTDNEDCTADMVEGTTFEGYRANAMTCYTASNYESVTVTVMDDAEDSQAAVLDACGPEGWMQPGCFAGPGWVIEAETKDALNEVLATLTKDKTPTAATTTASAAPVEPVQPSTTEPVGEDYYNPANDGSDGSKDSPLPGSYDYCNDQTLPQSDWVTHCSGEGAVTSENNQILPQTEDGWEAFCSPESGVSQDDKDTYC